MVDAKYKNAKISDEKSTKWKSRDQDPETKFKLEETESKMADAKSKMTKTIFKMSDVKSKMAEIKIAENKSKVTDIKNGWQKSRVPKYLRKWNPLDAKFNMADGWHHSLKMALYHDITGLGACVYTRMRKRGLGLHQMGLATLQCCKDALAMTRYPQCHFSLTLTLLSSISASYRWHCHSLYTKWPMPIQGCHVLEIATKW